MTVNESNEPRDEKFVEHEEELAAEEAATIAIGSVGAVHHIWGVSDHEIAPGGNAV